MCPPLVEIGLTDMPKTRRLKALKPQAPHLETAMVTYRLSYLICIKKKFWNYLHSTLGKQGGGSSEHSGLLIRQALHSCNALASNMVSCF